MGWSLSERPSLAIACVVCIDLLSGQGQATRECRNRSGGKRILLENLSSNFEDAVEEHPDCECLLGLCYGERSDVSGKIKKYLPGDDFEHVRIGAEFWEFVTGNPDADQRLKASIDAATESFDQYLEVVESEPPDGETFADLIETQTDTLLTEWRDRYGEGAESMDAFLGR